ncbi:pilus assembly protein [Cryobacterium sp. TMT1-3]|uniref:Pilus assembly protein n=1 Tax=Cryobacterium luteum TaxID=1424661 RepID=A0A1H8E6V8_9MICO|nr:MULTISPECIES: type II secretion system F family protein [Cryobacterium]TFB89833.1 pilus assembly protein [Cryobacterium luteum]TFC25546.1 pilus assembly protein [Cryobacterium sp. TMT1-3]SEN15311.1 type II secretion system protein F (GspF) [Cryobacterium luteum]
MSAALGSSALGWAVLCGSALGVGLWSLVSLTPRLTRPRLMDRVVPYILDISPEARRVQARRTVNPIPVLGSLFAPLVRTLTRGLSSLLGGSDTIARRLHQSGSAKTALEFRSVQLVWALLAFAAGTVITLVVLPDLLLPARLALPFVASFGGAMLRDWLLQRAAAARLARMRSELPTILEFLTLSLSAGEGILDSIRRVSRTSSGELSREFAGVVADVHTGVPIAAALQTLSRDIQLPEVTRFVDQVTGALDRGSPLAEVLRAQAQDSRDQTKRTLLELAGKKEVAMLVPLVFLILPMTVLFAVFPGLVVLQAGF